MTTDVEQQVLGRLEQLPLERVAKAVEFVDFLPFREERAAAAKRLADGMTRLDGLALPSVSEDEVEHEVQARRKARRDQRHL